MTPDNTPPSARDNRRAVGGARDWLPLVAVGLLAFLSGRYIYTHAASHDLQTKAGSFPRDAQEKVEFVAAQPGEAVVSPPDAPPRRVTPRGNMSQEELSTIDLFRRCSPSVVFINSSAVRRNGFSLDATEIPTGTGSGFIWDDKGHIVTNFHVIENANRAKVVLSNQESYDAELVGVAPDKDLAVLKIEVPDHDLPAIAVGTSEDLQVGQSVFAIGNPFGFDQTLTTGVISGLDRQIRSRTDRRIDGVIQTDAAINPGNS
ncbi:MAG: trypsin-like peptidase domain-containing protein, partial [Planctomycetales bacterium]|nr:trypsin-like peptidase domain-containing protein [Planctomycetales bacterium]